MNTDKFLPIGTVVLLKNATKKLMITGFYSVSKNNPDQIYDYNGCLYPEGILTSEKNALFNHNQIDKIYHFGLRNDEEKEFQQKLKEAITNQGNK